MELLFKVVADRPARMGIKYPYAYQALKDYEMFMNQCTNHTFSAKLEMINTRINLQLTSEQSGYKINYKDLEFKAVLLQKILSYIKDKEPIDFVHVYMEDNQAFVCKPFKKKQFITITHLELVGPEYFAGIM
ncbi:MAG: hypothetical protein H0W73_08070 [Bacteroidetes bacterium]|nr:hypothetical protein [Bacteroidota bacterium]